MATDKRSGRASNSNGPVLSRRSGMTAEAASRSSGPRPLADVLTQLRALRGHGQSEASRQLAELWERVAGPEISGKTRVIGLKNATLQIGVSNAALLGELTAFHQRRLVEALRNDPQGRRIRGLKFQLRST